MSLHQDLYGNDFLNRVNFCNWICRKMRTDVLFFWRTLDGQVSAKRTASINGRRALACSHAHVDPPRRCTTPLCSVFKTSDEWDFWRKLDRTRRPCSLPPPSPDLTSSNYFLWGFVNECVMAVAPITPDDMKKRLRRACTEITPQMLAEPRRSFHQRINKCLQVKGHHFERLP